MPTDKGLSNVALYYQSQLRSCYLRLLTGPPRLAALAAALQPPTILVLRITQALEALTLWLA